MSTNYLNAVDLLTAAGYNAANLVLVTALPAGSPYGKDLSCVADLDPSMVEVGGNTVLAQACARRLLTPRGTLIDDPDYGYDLEQWIGADIGPADVAGIQVAIQQELLKDERVNACVAVVTYSQATSVLVASVQVGGAAGQFAFVLTVSELSATIVVTPP